MNRAVWTRFHPLGFKLQELLFSGKLGKVKRFQADFSMQGDLEGESTVCFKTDTCVGQRADDRMGT